MTSPEEFHAIWDRVSASSADCMYAIYDKTDPSFPGVAAFGGIAALSATNSTHAVSEIGIIVLPQFQRSHVATNAVGLLLLWLLDPPRLGGLGLRRVAWQSNADNMKSRNFAARVGFELEGIARWNNVVDPGKVGVAAEALAVRNGVDEARPGRHTAIYSIVWDEWESKRPVLVNLMRLRK